MNTLRNITIGLVALLFIVTALDWVNDSKVKQSNNEQRNNESSLNLTCGRVSDKAELVMILRQSDKTMIQVMNEFQGDEEGISMVKRAYDWPSVRYSENKNKAIKDFTDSETRKCFKG
jgi:hypothetical protein